MPEEKILTITRGEEFKLTVKKEINETDIFYDQYVSAARMLDDIVASGSRDSLGEWCRTESENNIIAFCGERGEGKSSAMLSFVNAAYEKKDVAEHTIFEGCDNLKNVYFAKPMVIDPSMLDGVHNVLDIVLATLYREFRKEYENDNQFLNRSGREELLDRFQKVYRCVSLINNQAKMRDDEYDYEGNISKLSKLGESTSLRDELKTLVSQYLDIMPGHQKDREKTGRLMIAIDDLDLCSSNAYKMAEQIRKYLIIPNVVIVMAIKIEQLDLCVKEQNLKCYKNIMRMERNLPREDNLNNGQRVEYPRLHESGLTEEIIGMSERYVAKLIPKARRNYLPNVQSLRNVKIAYRDGREEKYYDNTVDPTINHTILDLIYQKTGMKFLPDRSGKSFLLPDNLRDMVNLIVLLGDMKEPDTDRIYVDNIAKFCNYFEKVWLYDNLDLRECRELQRLIRIDYLQLHENTRYELDRFNNSTDKKIFASTVNVESEFFGSFCAVVGWVLHFRSHVFGDLEAKYAYAFRILYTIRLHELLRSGQYEKLAEFLGGYVWAWNFANVLPNVQRTGFSRSRFLLPALDMFHTISRMLYPEKDIFLEEKTGATYYVSKIRENDELKNEKMTIWFLLGMLSNTYGINSAKCTVFKYVTCPVIFPNYVLLQNLHVSLENYLVSLCNLESLYTKIGMKTLGISQEEFHAFILKIEENNKDMIETARNILSNMDLVMEFIDYCSGNRDPKKGGADEADTSEAAADRFFRNVSSFSQKHLGKTAKFDSFVLELNGVKRNISISKFYAQLIQEGIRYSGSQQFNTDGAYKAEVLKEFAAILQEQTDKETDLLTVSSYLKNKSAENTKLQMENMASNIQRYCSLKMESLQESSISRLCDFYGRMLDIYIANPKAEIPKEMCEEYKKIYNDFKYMFI